MSLLCVICYDYILYLDLGFQCTCMNICSVYCKGLNVPVWRIDHPLYIPLGTHSSLPRKTAARTDSASNTGDTDVAVRALVSSSGPNVNTAALDTGTVPHRDHNPFNTLAIPASVLETRRVEGIRAAFQPQNLTDAALCEC
jgi:hypothetical protein